MQLTTHFSLEELIASDLAARKGIDNYPTAIALDNLKRLATVLETIREHLGSQPIHITSGYRCRALNIAVGGAKRSAHMDGLAADFECPAFGTPLEVCQAIVASSIDFDQVIFEFGSWCHFAIVHQGLTGRREVLTIDKNGTRKGLDS